MDVPVVTVQNCITFDKWNFERHGATQCKYVCVCIRSNFRSEFSNTFFCCFVLFASCKCLASFTPLGRKQRMDIQIHSLFSTELVLLFHSLALTHSLTHKRIGAQQLKYT